MSALGGIGGRLYRGEVSIEFVSRQRLWYTISGVILAISIIAGVFYVLAWEAALAAAHLDFAGGYAKAVIAQQQAKGISGEALARLAAEMDQFKIQYANPGDSAHCAPASNIGSGPPLGSRI